MEPTGVGLHRTGTVTPLARATSTAASLPFPAIRLFCTCWLIFAVHWAPFMIREQFPAVTLATLGTLNVERFVGWSPDIFQGPDGRAFINNNPGASIVGAVPLLLARPALDAVERWNDRSPSSVARRDDPEFAASAPVRERREWYFMAVAFLTVVGLMAPVSALAIAAFGWTLWSAGVPRRAAIGAALLLGFGTPIFVRTGYLNHNLLVCHAGLFAALLLWDREDGPVRAGRAAAGGALAGFAVLCDYSGVLVLGFGALYAWLRAGDHSSGLWKRLRVAVFYAAGAAPSLIALAAYQWWAFGHSVLPSQHFMPAIQETARGYRGMDWPSLELLWMNFFDPRFGLFAVCPLLATGLAAPFVRHGRFRVPTREMLLIFLFFGGFVLFCASNQYSRLQWSTGIRYLVPTIPGLLLLSLQVLQIVPVALRRALLLASVTMSWLPAVTHRPMTAFADGGEFQLSWTRRITKYGALSHPVQATVVVLLATTAAIIFMWRHEIVGGDAREVGSSAPP